MAYKDIHFYAVTTRHGGYNSFHTLAEAQNHANAVMNGYLEGLTCSNDPQPTIFKIQEVEQLTYNSHTKKVCKRYDGPSFGRYRDFDTYANREM